MDKNKGKMNKECIQKFKDLLPPDHEKERLVSGKDGQVFFWPDFSLPFIS